MNRLDCARETIRLLLEDVEADGALPQAWSGYWELYNEPEAQWSSKSTTKDKTWVGDNVQVAETVQEQPRQAGEPTANFLTAIVTQNAPASDKAGMAEVFDEQMAPVTG